MLADGGGGGADRMAGLFAHRIVAARASEELTPDSLQAPKLIQGHVTYRGSCVPGGHVTYLRRTPSGLIPR